jgi:hypothetical protein
LPCFARNDTGMRLPCFARNSDSGGQDALSHSLCILSFRMRLISA